MGLAEILFGLAMLLIPVGIAIPFAGSAVTPGEVTAARACFIVSAILLGTIEVGALMFDDKPPAWRIVTGTLVGMAIFVGLPEGLRWINDRQTLTPAKLGHKVTGKTGPDLVHSSDQNVPSNDFPDCPGWTAHAVIKLAYIPGSHRQNIIKVVDQKGMNIEFYLSAAETFTLALTDLRGETYSLPIPFNRNGIPFAQMIDLSVSAGIAPDRTILRVGVNGRTVAERVFPFSIGLVHPPWKPALGDVLSAGVPITGRGGAAFDLYEFSGWDTFLGSTHEKETSAAVVANYQIKD